MKVKSIEWDGRAITKPGCYSKIPLETYHSAAICDGPSVSSSGLRVLFAESPAHFYQGWPGNPNREEPEDKKHFIVGRAAHHLFLGEPYFAKLFCVQPESYPDKKTGELKKWTYAAAFCKEWAEQRKKEGRLPLTNGDVETIKGMAASLGRHPLVRAGALNGLIERSIFWKDKETGIWLKARPDAIPGDSGDFVDLKTTARKVLWHEIVRELGERMYHQQGALICRAAREVLGIDKPTFTLVFVEKQPPHCVRVVTVKEHELERGDKQNRMALDLMAKCLKDKKWPGPGDREDAQQIELSERQRDLIDTRLKYGIF